MPHSRLPTDRLTFSLPFLIVASVLLVAVAAGSIAAWSLFQQSRRSIETGLAFQARDKSEDIATYLTALRGSVVGIVSNPAAIKLLDNIGVSLTIMPPDILDALPSRFRAGTNAATTRRPNDFYDHVHAELDAMFRAFAQENGYGDVIFVTPNGTVGYTLEKRADFGENVHKGALKGTPLEAVTDRAMSLLPRTTSITDLQAYAPAQAPVVMTAAPVYRTMNGQQTLIGALVALINAAPLNAIVNDEKSKALGTSFLVGADGLMRSTLRPDEDLLLPGLAAGQTKLKALKVGLESGRITLDGGQSAFLASSPVGDGTLGWSVVAMQDADTVLRPVWQMVWQMVWRITLISFVLALLLAWLAATLAARLTRPVLTLVERFDAALSNMPHGLVMVDADRRLILCNTAYKTMYGLPDHLTQQGTSFDTIDGLRLAEGLTAIEPADWPASGTYRQDMADGRTMDVTRAVLPSGGYIATHQNITAGVRAQKQITYLATHDQLTGLPNRDSLAARVDAELALDRPRRRTMAVLCLDLDRFKTVNDTLGHSVGDLLLRAVAARLLDCLGGSDVLARVGGDEFIVFQPAIASPSEAGSLAQRCIDRLAPVFEIEGHDILVGLSVGIAVGPADGRDAAELIKHADLALYRAKADGRGVCRVFEPAMDVQSQARRQLELDLRQALTLGQFELAYQPVFNALTERVTTVEALVRWRHPDRGLVSPADFIPLAEERGLIVQIGEWVLRTACAVATSWPEDVRIAVNLSPIQMKSGTLVDTVQSALTDVGLSPRRLELEITETVLLSENENTLTTLHRLKQMGVRIAMDDFGTGYSSLSYLRSFPFDKIKIDQSFVRGRDEKRDAAAIVKAISDLGATLGMTTTAEGVETVAQLQMVRQQGCTEIQGYLLCRPVPASEIPPFFAPLAERRSA